MSLRAIRLAVLAVILASCRAPDQHGASTIPRFRGELDSADGRFVEGMNYDPADIALAWSDTRTIIVAHAERYSSADVFSGTCAGSGVFAVPPSGGPAKPLVVGASVCDAVLRSQGLAVDPSARWLVYSVHLLPNNSGLVRLDLRTARPETLSTGCRVYLDHPSISRDGRLIAAIGLCRNRQQPDWGAYVLRSDGSGLRDLAPGTPFVETAPAWSPDGSQLLLGAPTGLVIADTSGKLRRIAANGGLLSWSPDGQWVGFSSGAAISVARPTGSDLRPVFLNKERGTFSRGWGPTPEGLVTGPVVWSPDSKSLAFSRQFDRGISIWRLDLASARLTQVTAPDHR